MYSLIFWLRQFYTASDYMFSAGFPVFLQRILQHKDAPLFFDRASGR